MPTNLHHHSLEIIEDYGLQHTDRDLVRGQLGSTLFLSHRKKAGAPVWSQERGPSVRVVPLTILDPEKVRHLETGSLEQYLEDCGAEPEGVLGVDPNTVVV